MDEKASGSRWSDPAKRDEWINVNFLLREVEALRLRGLIPDEACRTIIEEYTSRRESIEKIARFDAAIKAARDLAIISPREALNWASRARELAPDRREGWVVGIDLLRQQRRYDEADRLSDEASAKFPDFIRRRLTTSFAPKVSNTPVERQPSFRPAAIPPTSEPKISWASVTGEFLEEHWQKLISCLAVLLIVVSSTVGASLVLGPLLWSPVGKVILAFVFTLMVAGFGVGLVKWGAERAGQVMLATTLILIPINLMILGELGLLVSPSTWNVGLVIVDAAVLGLLAFWVVASLGIESGAFFTASFCAIAFFNVGASREMPFDIGFPVFLAPSAIFLGAVSWLNGTLRKPRGEGLRFAYLEFGLLTFAFLSGVIRTGGAVLQLAPSLYAIPTILAAIAGVSTARAIEPIEKDRQRVLMFLQGGLTLSALAFAMAMARPPEPSTLFSANTLGVAILGLALYATSLRATRKPVYLYCGFAALLLALFAMLYFARTLFGTLENAVRVALGYVGPLPAPFRAVIGLVLNAGLAGLSLFFTRRWSDDRLARHCHYLGLPLSIAACVFSGFEPKAAVICLASYAILYAIATWIFRQPRLIYLACAAMAGSAYFAASLAGSTAMGLQSMLASVLGLIFCGIRAMPPLKAAGEAYRTPLIRSARVLAVLAMALASLASIQDGMISRPATLAFLLTAVLALLNGNAAPRVLIYLLAITAFLGSWLGGYHILIGGQASSLMAYGLAVACYGLALLGVGEMVRARFRESDSGRSYLIAMGWSVPVWVFVAWTLASWNQVDSVTVARAFLVGSSALLWLTRFRRESVLVYLGLGGLATWAGCLCGLVAPWERPGLAIAWLGVTSGGCSIVLWGVGEWVRRRGDTFYFDPCFIVSGVLAGLATLGAFDGWWLSAGSYRVGLFGTLTGTIAFGLIAASTRWPASVALAIASGVGSSVLVILRPGMTLGDVGWWLAFVFAVEAIVCLGIGSLIRRYASDSNSILARPLDYAALILALAAIPTGYASPTTLLLLAASSVLLVGCFPRAEWLYATFLALGSAVYHACLTGFSLSGLLPFVILGASLAWGVGVAWLRFGSKIRERFGWPDLAFEVPSARSTLALGSLALLIRLKLVLDAGGVWTSHAWFFWSLGLLCLLMLRFEPKRRGWVHASAGFSGLGFTAMLAPIMDPQVWWVSASMARGLFWAVAGNIAIRGEESFRKRIGIGRGFDAEVFQEWALAMGGLSILALLGIVGSATFWQSFEAISSVIPGGWPDVMVAIGLAGLFLSLEARRFDRDGRWIGLEVVALLAVWWLGASASPLPIAIDRPAYLALATSGFVLGIVLLGFETERQRSIRLADPLFDPGPEPPIGLERFTSWLGFGLGLSTVYFSRFNPGRIALPSLLVASGALGILAIGWRRLESAILGSLTWCLAVPVGFVLLNRAWDVASEPVVVAMGLETAIVALWFLAGWLRTRPLVKGNDPIDRISSAIEWVAIAVTLPAGCLGWLGDSRSPLLGTIVILGLAVFFAAVAWRKRADWPVYPAQVLLLLAYFRIRGELAPSELTDAVILSMLGYLDLGLSELLGRFRLTHFARPTFRFAMVLPMVPILQGIWSGRGDEVDLFILLATSGFYAMTSFKLRSKTPAYASAVLLNAFLWLAWYRLGWRFVDRPQFYLIPVGFSSILFAEVNRRDLSRSVINGARNLGLVTIYASLAAPIWQTQSFGAWLVLLLLSLVGIFAGIGLRVQSFLWLGLVSFVADLIYQLTRLGIENALARWGVTLTLGVALIVFVAVNEKKRVVATLRAYYFQARTWE